ncbi:hypothetical protein NBRC116188_30080 [Oceaniserpentilla sp. 4NH20-0058]
MNNFYGGNLFIFYELLLTKNCKFLLVLLGQDSCFFHKNRVLNHFWSPWRHTAVIKISMIFQVLMYWLKINIKINNIFGKNNEID